MDIVTEENNRGANIKPSARKSIHNNSRAYNSTYETTMGKYGINVHRKKQTLKQSSPQENSVDEVDNVMSKMARPSSPLVIRRSNPTTCRRNSVDTAEVNNEYSDDESDDDEELYTSALNEQDNRNGSKYSLNMSQRSRWNESVNLNNSTSPVTPQKINSYNILFKMALLVIIFGIIIYNCYTPGSLVDDTTVYDKSKFYNDVKHLEEKYKVKYTSILQVKTGVATIYENQDAGSFIFTYNSENNHFNPVKFNSFVEDLAATASRYLRNESKEVHVAVDTSNLKMNSVYEFMNEYREGLDKTGVMIVKDLYNVPSDLAMAFHYYCDEYNPLVKKSAIFFTLNLSNCSEQDPKSTHGYIEKCLAKKWNSIDEDKIGPLLTRVVNVVIDVTATF